MNKAQANKRVQDFMNDPDSFIADHTVSDERKQIISDALSSIPTPILEVILDKNIPIITGDKSFCDNHCFNPNNDSAFYASGTGLIINNNVQTDMLRHVVLHEVGHALDDINGLKSMRSKDYEVAVEGYLKRENEAIEMAYENHDLSADKPKINFRQADRPFSLHAMAYDGIHVQCEEHAAEMFEKYVERSEKLGSPQKADISLLNDYGASWAIYKEDICPQVQKHIDSLEPLQAKQGLSKDFENAAQPSFVAKIAGLGRDALKAVKNAMFGEAKQPVRWSSHNEPGRTPYYSCETTQMGDKQRRQLTDELSANKIRFTTGRDGDRTSLIVHDPASIDKLKQLGQQKQADGLTTPQRRQPAVTRRGTVAGL